MRINYLWSSPWFQELTERVPVPSPCHLPPAPHSAPTRSTPPSARAAWARSTKARDTRLDRTVAIKVLPEHVAADPDLKQRFEREANTISSLNHPHICTLYDVGNQDGIDFLVMEYLDGETLARRLEKGALPLDQALKIASRSRMRWTRRPGRGLCIGI